MFLFEVLCEEVNEIVRYIQKGNTRWRICSNHFLRKTSGRDYYFDKVKQKVEPDMT